MFPWNSVAPAALGWRVRVRDKSEQIVIYSSAGKYYEVFTSVMESITEVKTS